VAAGVDPVALPARRFSCAFGRCLPTFALALVVVGSAELIGEFVERLLLCRSRLLGLVVHVSLLIVVLLDLPARRAA